MNRPWSSTHVVVGDISGYHWTHEPADGGDAVADAHQGASVVGRELAKVNLKKVTKEMRQIITGPFLT